MKKAIVVFAAFVAVGLAAQAQVIKCKGADGKTVYSDTACLGNSSSQSVNTTGGTIDTSSLRQGVQRERTDQEMTALMQNPPIECKFKSYKNGDEKGKVLADKAAKECVENLVAKRNGQPTSTADYQMWKDHNADSTAKRYAPRSTMNCVNSGFGTATCR